MELKIVGGFGGVEIVCWIVGWPEFPFYDLAYVLIA